MSETLRLIAPADKRIISLSGYSYDQGSGVIFFDSWDERDCRRHVWAPQQKSFTIVRLKGRICTGRYDISTFESRPCPHRAPLHTGSNACPDCTRAIGFTPFFYNVSRQSISKRQQLYNQQPHCVYLAYFGRDVVKVGISSEARLNARLLEQGAWLAVRLIRCDDAWAAREIEHRISKFPTIVETIRNDRKRRLLAQTASSTNARSIFCSSILEVARELGLSTDLDIIDLRESCGEFGSAEGALDGSDSRPYVISGKALAMIGPNIVLQNGSNRVIFDLDNIISHRCSWRPEIEPVNCVPLQTAMFKE